VLDSVGRKNERYLLTKKKRAEKCGMKVEIWTGRKITIRDEKKKIDNG